MATFYDEAHPAGVQVYVDLATGHGWTTIRPGVTEFHLIDMDLDVIRTVDRGVYVDDEDEFAEHRIEMDYPADVVDRIRRRRISFTRPSRHSSHRSTAQTANGSGEDGHERNYPGLQARRRGHPAVQGSLD